MHSQRQPYSRLNPLLPASMIAQVEAETEGAEALAVQRSASTSLNGLDLQSWKTLADRDDVVARERSS